MIRNILSRKEGGAVPPVLGWYVVFYPGGAVSPVLGWYVVIYTEGGTVPLILRWYVVNFIRGTGPGCPLFLRMRSILSRGRGGRVRSVLCFRMIRSIFSNGEGRGRSAPCSRMKRSILSRKGGWVAVPLVLGWYVVFYPGGRRGAVPPVVEW